MRRLCTLVLGSVWLVSAYAADRGADVLREDGLLEYERGHYAAALTYFRGAAVSGDPRSAEILALMYRFGPRLYGDGVPADAAESARWAAAATQGRRSAVEGDQTVSRAGS